MADWNTRVQAVETTVKRVEDRLDDVDSAIDGIGKAVARIEGSLSGIKDKGRGQTHQWVTAIATVAAVLVALGGNVGAYIQGEQTRKSVQGQVTRIQSDLQLLAGVLAPQLLNRIGPIITAAASAPDSSVPGMIQQPIAAIRLLRDEKAKNDPSSIRDASQAVGQLSRAHPNVPQVWQAASELISYRSESPHYGSVDIPQHIEAKPCFGGVAFERLTIKSDFTCAIYLDRTPLKNMTIENAFIVYRGGKVHIEGVTFVRCIFVIDIQSPPTPTGRDYMNQLLEADNIEKTDVNVTGE